MTRIHSVARANRDACIAEMVSKNYVLWYQEDFDALRRLVFILVS